MSCCIRRSGPRPPRTRRRDGRTGLYFDDIFAGVTPDITAASLAICHLETPLAPTGGPYRGYPRFSVPPQIATTIRDIGYDTCSTASNHTLDQGTAGIKRTLDDLDAAGVRHAGSYRSAGRRRRCRTSSP